MNSVHDMGGMHGMGSVEIEADEPVFHADWEKRVFATRLACAYHRRWNSDINRYAVERMPPADYLASSYYEHVLFGGETVLTEQGVVTVQELTSGRAEGHADVNSVLDMAGLNRLLQNRIRARREEKVAPKFKAGDTVVARNIHPAGHTRLPRYVRGRHGIIDRDFGVYVFPDTNAMSRDPKPQHLYTVRFNARELWGPGAAARDSVYVNLWDDHLDPA
jgi:nitrile hydratase subunit beta